MRFQSHYVCPKPTERPKNVTKTTGKPWWGGPIADSQVKWGRRQLRNPLRQWCNWVRKRYGGKRISQTPKKKKGMTLREARKKYDAFQKPVRTRIGGVSKRGDDWGEKAG